MFKRIVLILCLINPLAAFAQEKLNAGVSLDYNLELTSDEKGFIDLNYAINTKHLDILSEDEVKIKKTRKCFSMNFVLPPEDYDISFTTGKIEGKTNSSNDLASMLRKNPNNRELLFAYAIQLKKENKFDLALKTADKALEIDPDYALAHFLRGDILRNLERFKEAADEYIYTAQINPYCADAYYNIAKILELLDDNELALDYYKTAYQINPNDVEIREIILRHYIDL